MAETDAVNLICLGGGAGDTHQLNIHGYLTDAYPRKGDAAWGRRSVILIETRSKARTYKTVIPQVNQTEKGRQKMILHVENIFLTILLSY